MAKDTVIIDNETGEEIIIDIDIDMIDKDIKPEEPVEIITDEVSAESRFYQLKIQPHLKHITSCKALGMRDSDIAQLLDISTSSFSNYKRDIFEVRKAYEDGMNILLDDVELSMYNEAKGYDYEETVVNNKTGDVVSISKHARANPTFAKFVLKNKRGEDWKEKTEIEKRNIIDVDFSPLLQLSTEEIKGLLDASRVVIEAPDANAE